MKIILITEDYPPTSGGIAQWAYGITTQLVKNNHDVTVMTLSRVFGLEAFEYNGERIIKMNSWQWHNFRSIYIAYYFIKELIWDKPDLVIASVWNIGAFPASIKWLFKYKVILAYHGLEITKKLSPKRKLKLNRAIKNADLNIAVSNFTKKQICDKYNIPDNKITVVHNGVDTKRFYEKEKSKDLVQKYGLANRKVLLSLSRVIERKGHDIVIEAIPLVIRKIPDLKYIIAGVYDEQFYIKLMKLIKKHSLESHVVVTGSIESELIIDYYNLCDVYIMVSKGSGESGDSEGFGITYLEANACGKSVIASNVDGIPDAVKDGVNGVLIEAKNVQETSDAIIKLFCDDNYRKNMEKNGLKRVKELFTWDVITSQLLNHIKGMN